MPQENQKLLKKARVLFISLTAGVVVLALEGLLTGVPLFSRFALGLGVSGLIVISLIIAGIVKNRD